MMISAESKYLLEQSGLLGVAASLGGVNPGCLFHIFFIYNIINTICPRVCSSVLLYL